MDVNYNRGASASNSSSRPHNITRVGNSGFHTVLVVPLQPRHTQSRLAQNRAKPLSHSRGPSAFPALKRRKAMQRKPKGLGSSVISSRWPIRDNPPISQSIPHGRDIRPAALQNRRTNHSRSSCEGMSLFARSPRSFAGLASRSAGPAEVTVCSSCVRRLRAAARLACRRRQPSNGDSVRHVSTQATRPKTALFFPGRSRSMSGKASDPSERHSGRS